MFSLEGRISIRDIHNHSRFPFAFFLIVPISVAIVTFPLTIYVTSKLENYTNLQVYVGYFYVVGSMAPVLWCLFAFIVKRMHDRDKSAWLVVCYILVLLGLSSLASLFKESQPILSNLFWFSGVAMMAWGAIEIFTREGTKGDNRFGPEPSPFLAKPFTGRTIRRSLPPNGN